VSQHEREAAAVSPWLGPEPDKQTLLAEPDAARRLSAERALLAQETTMLRTLPSTPAADLRYSPYSNN
jgi:uncharacterized protein